MPLCPPIPGYAAAVARETDIRDNAFAGVPEQICGVDVLPLTSEHVDALQAIGSPFICGGREITIADIAFFFWIVSPYFVPGCRLLWWKPGTWLQVFRATAARKRVFKSLRKIVFGEAVAAINKYLDEAYMDAPGGSKKRRVMFVSWKASAVHLIATAYGWDDSRIRSLPLKILWQYQRAIRLSRGDTLINSLSDKVRGDFIKTLNAAAPATDNKEAK